MRFAVIVLLMTVLSNSEVALKTNALPSMENSFTRAAAAIRANRVIRGQRFITNTAACVAELAEE